MTQCSSSCRNSSSCTASSRLLRPPPSTSASPPMLLLSLPPPPAPPSPLLALAPAASVGEQLSRRKCCSVRVSSISRPPVLTNRPCDSSLPCTGHHQAAQHSMCHLEARALNRQLPHHHQQYIEPVTSLQEMPSACDSLALRLTDCLPRLPCSAAAPVTHFSRTSSLHKATAYLQQCEQGVHACRKAGGCLTGPCCDQLKVLSLAQQAPRLGVQQAECLCSTAC